MININSDSIVGVAAIILICAVIYGFIRKAKSGNANSMISDVLVDEVKGIVMKEISGVLSNAGLATDYYAFKDYVIRSLLKKVRKYFDDKGGKIDEITDAISDESVIDAINLIIEMSDIEDEIKASYDKLINARLSEIDKYESEVEEENNRIETESLDQYEDEEASELMVDDSEPVVIKADEE